MSIISSNRAIISLGVSCQAGYQLKHNARFVSDLVGEEFRPARFPFDWMISTPQAVRSMVENLSFFPHTSDELVHRPDIYMNAVHWPRHNIHFWHDFLPQEESVSHNPPGSGGIDIAARFDRTQKKYLYIKERLMSFAGHKTFVLCNTQNDLNLASAATGFDFRFSKDDVDALASAIELCFPGSSLHVVYYSDRVVDHPISWQASSYCMPKNHSPWQGDTTLWQSVLHDLLRPRPAG